MKTLNPLRLFNIFKKSESSTASSEAPVKKSSEENSFWQNSKQSDNFVENYSPTILSPMHSTTRSSLSARHVKNRGKITPEQFRNGFSEQTDDLSLSYSYIPSPVQQTPTKKVFFEEEEEEEERTESFIDIEKSAVQTPMTVKRSRVIKGPAQPLIKLKITQTTREGEIEKQAAMLELSKLVRLKLIPTEIRDQIFSSFALRLDQFNKKKSKRDEERSQREQLESMRTMEKNPEDPVKECNAMMEKLEIEKNRWSKVELPKPIVVAERKNKRNITLEPVKRRTQYSEELIVQLDKLSLAIQSFDAANKEIGDMCNEIAASLSEIATSSADPLLIASRTKRQI